ncbi:MAG TPA: CHAT domain-containing tetratricopeptide repeat protein [Drouetiella sp.]|jgi:CHAT domain-containing protein/Tfp pilus assembly protein PilF
MPGFHNLTQHISHRQQRANYKILPIIVACASSTFSASWTWASEQTDSTYSSTPQRSQKLQQKTNPPGKQTTNSTQSAVSNISKDAEDLETYAKQSIAEAEKESGKDSLQATDARFNYVKVLKNKGKDAEAEGLCREVLAQYIKLCGPESLQVAKAEDHLGRILRHQFRLAESETHQRKALALCKKLLPPDDPETAAKMEDLAKVLTLLPGRRQEAKKLYLDAYAMAEKGGDSQSASYIAMNLATSCLLPDGETAEARKYVAPVLEKFAKDPGYRPDSRATMLMLMGASYAKEKQFDLAKSYYQQALSIFQNYAPNHPKVATCHEFMADDEIKRGEYSQASKDLLRAIQIRPNHSGGTFGRLCQQQRFKFINLYQDLIERKGKSLGEQIPVEYQILKAIQKEPDKDSTGLLEQIYKTRSKHLGIHNVLTSEAALQLAVQLTYLNGKPKPLIDSVEPDFAEFARALVSDKSANNPSTQNAIQILGDKETALDFTFEDLLLLAELRGEEKEFQSTQQNLLLAEKCLSARHPQTKSNQNSASSTTTLAGNLLRLSMIWQALGKYNRATQLTESAIELINKQKIESELKYNAYLQLGNLNLAESDTEAASKNARVAEAVAYRLFGTTSNKLLPCYRLLSQIKLSTGDYTNGSDYALKAQLCSNLNKNDAIWIHDNLGFCALSEGRYNEAKDQLTKALSFCDDSKNQQPEDRNLFTAASTALAETLVKMGDREEALRELDWALSTDRANSETESLIASARDCAGIATVHQLDGDKELAASYALQAAEFTDKFLRSGFSELSFAQQCSFVNVTHQIRSILLNTCTDQQNLPQAYGYIIKWKGLLLETLRSQSVIASTSATASSSTKKSIADLSAVRARLGALASGNEESLAEFNELSAKKERIERDLLRDTNSNTISDPLAKRNVSWLQNLLKPNQAFLDILTYNSLNDNAEHYALIALKAGNASDLKMFDLGQSEAIDKEIATWRNNITQQFPEASRGERVSSRDLRLDQERSKTTLSSEDYLKLTNQLASLFVNNPELHKFLSERINEVWLCPEAAMARMPWATLSTICGTESFGICEIDSPREFAQIMTENQIPKSANHLLLAGVSAFHDSAFNDLPGTGKEINGIEAVAKRSGISYEVLINEQANKKNVRAKIEAASVVHFSTHGFARGDKITTGTNYTADSASTNSHASGTRSKDSAASNVYFGLMSLTPSIARNPLTDSGLVLSADEAKTTSKDDPVKQILTANADTGPKWRDLPESLTNKRSLANLLTAEEIVGLNLRNCKLVSLSACKTGLGTGLEGQGVLGLRSAIMAAGARSILMSLWSVDDDATQELMRKFYGYLLDPQTPLSEAEALKKAQEYIRAQPQWQSPNYWSGWVIAGDGWQKVQTTSH